jgi:hypothetical protein
MDANPVALVDPWGDKAKGPRQNQYKAKGGNGRGAIACPGEKKEPQTNSLNSFINNKIQEEFGKTITLDQFNKLNDGIVDYLKTQDKGSGYTLDSSYDGNTGEYVFDIQEASMKRSVIGTHGGDNVKLLGSIDPPLQGAGASDVATAVSFIAGSTEVQLSRKLKKFRPVRFNDGRLFRRGTIVRDIESDALMTGSRYLQSLRGVLYWTGAAAGTIGIIITINDYLQGNISGGEFASDMFFGGVGFIGPVGLMISTTYSIVTSPAFQQGAKEYREKKEKAFGPEGGWEHLNSDFLYNGGLCFVAGTNIVLGDGNY